MEWRDMSEVGFGELYDRKRTRGDATVTETGSEELQRNVLANRDFAKQKTEELRTAADEAFRVVKFWQDLSDYLAKNWPLHVLRELDRNQAQLAALGAAISGHPVDFATIRQQALEEAETQQRRFPGLVEQESKRLGLPLDAELSRHPKYCFRGSFLQVEILEAKGLARLSNNEGRLAELPADVVAMLLAIQAEDRRIFGRTFDGKAFIKKLYGCYREILRKEKQPAGKSIPIRKITSRFGKNEKGFRTDEFIADLSRLLEQGPTEIAGHALDLQQTKDTNQGMLLHGSAGRGYVGFISFRKAGP